MNSRASLLLFLLTRALEQAVHHGKVLLTPQTTPICLAHPRLTSLRLHGETVRTTGTRGPDTSWTIGRAADVVPSSIPPHSLGLDSFIGKPVAECACQSF